MIDPLWTGGEPVWRRWWPALLGPAMIVLVVAIGESAGEGFFVKSRMEIAGYTLSCIAALCFIWRFVRDRMEVHLALAILAAEFFHREFGHNKTIYVALVLIAVWGVARFKALKPQFSRGRLWPWIMCTGWTYFLSQFIAKRGLGRSFPYELEYHMPWEEMLENTAHLMFIVTAFADRLGPRPPTATAPSDEGTRPPASAGQP